MMVAMLSGILLGLAAGLTPGPLLGLVLTQTLRHGAREGCKVAFSPLITDAPIVALSLALAARAAELRPLLGMISLAGGAFVLYLAWDAFHSAPLDAQPQLATARSWVKGILTNLLSPHPWLFWMTVGAAVLAKALAQSGWVAAAFLFGFYLLLIGSKVLVALLAGRSRALLSGRWYRVVLRALSVLLALLALLLFRDGLRLSSMGDRVGQLSGGAFCDYGTKSRMDLENCPAPDVGSLTKAAHQWLVPSQRICLNRLSPRH